MNFKNFIACTLGGGWKIYTKHYSSQVEADAGYYKGRLWKIVSCNGIYPLVYIEGDEDVYGDGISTPAHGGITFRGPRYDLGMPSAIGYDYCHSGDYVHLPGNVDKKIGEGKLYSLYAIRRNIKQTIKWLNQWEAEHENSK